MKIAIVTQGLTFNGDSLATEGLGGSETAVLCMAQALGDLGDEVSVFCNCDKPGLYGNVAYYKASEFDRQMSFSEPDVIIASRWSEYLARGHRSALNVIWLHDTPHNNKSLVANSALCDIAFVLSEFQKELYEEEIPQLNNIYKVTRNGLTEDLRHVTPNIDMENFDVFYTSRPERGLGALLTEVMPRVWEKVPQARLKVATYFNDDPAIAREIRELHKACLEEMSNLGDRAVFLGGLKKEALYEQMRNSAVLAYPTVFPEISCISAMEAQANGLPLVTTDSFALSETAAGGVLVKDWYSEDYFDRFSAEVVNLLQNEDARVEAAARGQEHVKKRKYFWKDIAKEWQTLFAKMLSDRLKENKEAAVASLIADNEYEAARIAADSIGVDFTYEFDDSDEQISQEHLQESKEVHNALTLLLEGTLQPRRILCVPNGIECQSYWHANSDGPEVVVMAEDEVHKGILQSILSSLGRKARVETEEDLSKEAASENGKFDLLILTKSIENKKFYRNYLKEVQAKFLRKTGMLATVNSFGHRLSSASRQKCNRYWRVSVRDLQKIFDGASVPVRVCPVAIGSSSSGDKYGAYVSLCGYCKSPSQMSVNDKLLRSRPYQKVSLCMIVGNDYHWLPQCLHAVEKYVDEIILIDTANSEDTKAIAKRYGAKWFHEPFQDFSTARNASISKATGDWVLWMDCDEQLIDPQNFRRYLQSVVFDGFAIKQNHLMLDADIDPDNPIRLFRRLPKYKFRGLIHEHPEDTERGDYDTPIEPSLLISDVDIAHFGYVKESMRRRKCSRRNMTLLLKDVEENGKKGRMLTWVLVARDYVNIAKWEMEKYGGKVPAGGIGHAALEAAIETYWSATRNADKYLGSARKNYQEALMIMYKSGLSYRPYGMVPFLANASFGRVTEDQVNSNEELPVNLQMFLCEEEYADFCRVESARQVGEDVEPKWVLQCGLPEPERILSHAVSVNLDLVAA